QMALVSEDAPYAELEDWARELKDRFKGVVGVRQAETWAYPERELRVALDLERMARLGVLPGQVMAALASENANIPAGVVDVGPRSFSLRTTGSYERLEQVRDTVVTAVDGQRIRVSDLAEVSWSTAADTYLGRFDGRRAVFVTANQQDGHSIFDTRDRLHAVAQDLASELPSRIQLELGFDQAENVAHRLERLGIDFGIAIGLVLITLLPLGLRAGVVVMVAIPLSLAMGVAALHALGQSLNQLSIAGFVVALGLLVDDSIVVVENIARHLREGMSRTRAAIEGTKQIFQAVLGCTATLLFAFLPLLALPGNAGKFIRVMPSAVVATVIASLIVALTIVPFLASRMLARDQDEHGNWFLQKLLSGITRIYRPLLHRALARPGLTVVLALALFVASLGLVP
ncbi:MAG: efflux RND transporter permease subunit, partial [Xanthomonadales bacterium]|nr:efflux RND transporter permease subunit [Xanthomonadales bacterium]